MPITTVHFGFAKAKDQVVITNGACYPVAGERSKFVRLFFAGDGNLELNPVHFFLRLAL